MNEQPFYVRSAYPPLTPKDIRGRHVVFFSPANYHDFLIAFKYARKVSVREVVSELQRLGQEFEQA